MGIGLTRHVFVDESGGTDLSKDGKGNDFYVLCALLIPEDSLGDSERQAADLVKKHAGSGELKSSNVSNNSARRRRILADISTLFPYYVLVVNKSLVWQDSGLKFKSTFYKFLHRMLYNRLVVAFNGLSVIADEYGRDSFMESFQSYIQAKASIFERLEFEESKRVPLLQIADMIAGSIRRVYQRQETADILDSIDIKHAAIEEWPPPTKPLVTGVLEPGEEIDRVIRRVALQNAKVFVESKLRSDETEEQMQGEAVRFLVERFYREPTEFVFRNEIARHLNEVFSADVNEQYVTTNIFGDARDQHVLVVSTDSGNKLPYTFTDLIKWTERVNSQVLPYVRRLERARNDIKLAAGLDIVPEREFPELAQLLRKDFGN